MVNRVKSLCLVPLPYPQIAVKEPNLRYAKMLSVPYAGAGGELSTILQYVYGHLVCEKQKPALIADVFSYIAEVEMRHLNMLGGLICELGGAPKFQSADARGGFQAAGIEYAVSPDRLLSSAAAGERRAVALYRKIIGNVEDDGVRAVLNRIVQDEEHHISIFTELASERN